MVGRGGGRVVPSPPLSHPHQDQNFTCIRQKERDRDIDREIQREKLPVAAISFYKEGD